jgi:hypothetical protein
MVHAMRMCGMGMPRARFGTCAVRIQLRVIYSECTIGILEARRYSFPTVKIILH